MIKKMTLSILFALASYSATTNALSLEDIKEDIADKERKLEQLQERIDNQLDPTTRHDLENLRRGKEKRLQDLYDQLNEAA